MLIQAYTMAFNEAEWIGQWARSALACCDIATVFDNGSTDATVALARAEGAEVVPMEPQPEGCVDYNDARFEHGRRRNECIAQLRGDWILNLDADEVLECSPDLLRQLAIQGAAGYAFWRYDLWVDPGFYRADWLRAYPWFWPNHRGIRYGTANPPHEALTLADGRELLPVCAVIPLEKARILHYHYVRGWKALRHLGITEQGRQAWAQALLAGTAVDSRLNALLTGPLCHR